MTNKDKVKKALEKTKKQKLKEQQPEEPQSREIHPLESNVIFREELLAQLTRIANALEILARPKLEVE